MKTTVFALLLFFVSGNLIFAQPIPPDSLYLGQTPPGAMPQVFQLSVSPGSFAAERIAISPDNTGVYYSEIDTYYPTTGAFIKYYSYSGNHWTGPFTLYEDFLAPAMSVNGDTMIFQSDNSDYQSYYSVLNSGIWSSPRRFLLDLNSAHYCQSTDPGNFYISSSAVTGIGGNDWCRLEMNSQDTTVVSLGLPVNNGADNLDFFIARDESFMVLAKNGLKISYHKDDGSWTNPKNLGAHINFGLGMWGPYVSADNKYLFYTTGTQPDYSDTYIYWVQFDNLMDSLQFTNYDPYVKNLIPEQYAYVGHPFSYTVPENTFFDDDGNETLTFTARMGNNTPLPSWLAFDTITATFSGIPPSIAALNLKIKATDDMGSSVTTLFKINIVVPTAIEPARGAVIRAYPNPTSGLLKVSCDVEGKKSVKAQIVDILGHIICQKEITTETDFDLSESPAGIYFLSLEIQGEKVVQRISVL
jgi:hypothetical protein